MASVLETKRLTLRRITLEDTAFFLELWRDPDFAQYVHNFGAATEKDAADHIRQRHLSSYDCYGFGGYLVQLNDRPGVVIGLCGLLKRDFLDFPDLGYAFLKDFRGHGYAREASFAVIQCAKAVHHIPRLLAIISPRNQRSIQIAAKLGFTYEFQTEFGKPRSSRLL